MSQQITILDNSELNVWYKTLPPVRAAIDQFKDDMNQGLPIVHKTYYDLAAAKNAMRIPAVTINERIAALIWALSGKLDESGILPNHFWKHADQLTNAETGKNGTVIIGAEENNWKSLVFIIEDRSLEWIQPAESGFIKLSLLA